MGLKQRLLGLGAVILLSGAGALALQQREGLRTTAYPDPATGGAPWTICWGHTGPEVYRGLTVSRAQCEQWYWEDVAEAESYLRRYIRVPVRQGAWDAYVSFVFNVGPENFRTSTMLRKLNAGDWRGSCNQFPRWVYANRMRMEGLAVRRYSEQRQCLLEGTYVYVPKS